MGMCGGVFAAAIGFCSLGDAIAQYQKAQTEKDKESAKKRLKWSSLVAACGLTASIISWLSQRRLDNLASTAFDRLMPIEVAKCFNSESSAS